MNRREALFATGALLAAAGTAQAADHSHHHHEGAHPWQAVLDTAGICIEKGFQPGGTELRAAGYKLASLAIVNEMSDDHLTFREQ